MRIDMRLHCWFLWQLHDVALPAVTVWHWYGAALHGTATAGQTTCVLTS